MSSTTKYTTNIKNIGCVLNAFVKLNFDSSIANFVPLHAGHKIPYFSLKKHFGNNSTYSDLKNIKIIKIKNKIISCVSISFLYCFFIIYHSFDYIVSNILLSNTFINKLLQIFTIYSKLVLSVNK